MKKPTESYRMEIFDLSKATPRQYEYAPKIFNIWMEGYQATGESAQATHLATIEAQSFKEACHIHYCNSWLKYRQEAIDNKTYRDYSRFDYDPINLSIWGCRLYDNEADARKFNG